MKLILFIIICFTTSVKAQSAAGTYQMKGKVADSTSKAALDYITVSLKSDKNVPVKSALTKADGAFTFSGLKSAKYVVTVIAIGYSSKSITVDLTDTTQKIKDLGTIYIASKSSKLNEVVVSADRPLIKQEVDRIAYDVQADPESKIDNVLDMLRKVPMVSIDADDNIQVKGSGNFKVLINGRPSSLVARDPKEVFKSMPASNIQKIEVITTPPAKYDSEGLAGIINIITNKKIDNGYNGSIGTRYDFLNGPGANASLTVKTKKLGFSFYSALSRHQAPSSLIKNFRTGLLPVRSQLNQVGSRKFKGKYGYVNGELSYEIDSLNLLTGSIGYNNSDGVQTMSNMTTQFNESGDLRQSYRLDNDNNFGWGGSELGLNYQLGFKKHKEQLLTASYKFNSNKEDQLSEISVHEKMNYENTDYNQKNNSGTNEQTIQLDYAHPLKKLNIEGGFKTILRDNFSDYGVENFDPLTGTFVVNSNSTNKFNYQQNVFSFYNSYQLKLDKWGFKGGLRVERTVIDADFVSTATKFDTDYNNFIPSVSIQRKLKKMSTLNLGYTQRIQRPGIWELNPFVDQADPKFMRSGNINLKPVLNHNFDLTYSIFKKGSINTGLSYSFANNTIQYVSTLGADGVTRTTFENIGKNKNLGVNLNSNYPVTKKLSVNVNARISHIWIEGVVNNKFYENTGIQGNTYISPNYKFKNDWRASLNAGYYSAWITLQGQSNPYYHTSASLSKDFLNKKASLSASVSNPFQKFRSWRNETNTPDFIQVSDYRNYYRRFNMSFSYRFGKLKDQIKKNKRGINNDDVSGGKSGGNQ